MLFKKFDKVSGKTLKVSRPLLVRPADAYARPGPGRDWFMTTTTIWPVDEMIKRRVRDWRRLTDETGHSGERSEIFREDHDSVYTGTYSVFPAPLMEWIILRYGGSTGGLVLDAFSGGPPRAVVSCIMGMQYHGVEIRKEQIKENLAVIKKLQLEGANFHLADGRFLDADKLPDLFDVAITCPPYFDLEVYSDQADDVSTFKTYQEFNAAMWMSAMAHYERLKPGAFACWVIGNFRDKKTGELIDFRADTVRNFRDAGFTFWQEIILSKNFGSAAKRSTNAWKGLKLVPRHEFLLVFRKPDD